MLPFIDPYVPGRDTLCGSMNRAGTSAATVRSRSKTDAMDGGIRR
jgi:hypothetical protein